LPASITFKDGKTIQYTYGADGRKLKVVYTTKQPSTTHVIDYCGNMIYEEGKLKRMLVDGAYISFDKGYSEYFYYIQDHLGNNRVIFNIDSEAEQINRYYPYGGLMAESTGWDVQRYKYNGKEFDRMHGLDWYDYGARMYDPAVGQYHTMDRFAEKYYNLSPYSYCAGNPINSIDVNGDSIYIEAFDEEGVLTKYYYGNYDGTYGFGRNGVLFSGESQFISSATSALNKLREGECGRNLVDGLSGKTSMNIRITQGNESMTDIKNNVVCIQWNDTQEVIGIDINGGVEVPTYITLGHELYHGEDLVNGTSNSGTWLTPERDGVKSSISLAEFETCVRENHLREEHGLPARVGYVINYHNSLDPQKWTPVGLIFQNSHIRIH
jgi:RHS repeat-associated protein